jgi:methionine-rich copper-binding protein CopC
MATGSRTVARVGWRGAAALAVTAALCMPATPAWAHAKLLRTSPAEAAQVADPVTAVTLTFNEMVRQRSTTVAVTGADGTSYSDGAARVVDHDVIQAVRPLPAGTYRVVWKTVSADGDPTQGQFGFTMAAPPSPTPSQTQNPTPSPPPAATSEAPGAAAERTAASSGTGWIWALVVAILLAALVAGAFVWRRRRTP